MKNTPFFPQLVRSIESQSSLLKINEKNQFLLFNLTPLYTTLYYQNFTGKELSEAEISTKLKSINTLKSTCIIMPRVYKL